MTRTVDAIDKLVRDIWKTMGPQRKAELEEQYGMEMNLQCILWDSRHSADWFEISHVVPKAAHKLNPRHKSLKVKSGPCEEYDPENIEIEMTAMLNKLTATIHDYYSTYPEDQARHKPLRVELPLPQPGNYQLYWDSGELIKEGNNLEVSPFVRREGKYGVYDLILVNSRGMKLTGKELYAWCRKEAQLPDGYTS